MRRAFVWNCGLLRLCGMVNDKQQWRTRAFKHLQAAGSTLCLGDGLREISAPSATVQVAQQHN